MICWVESFRMWSILKLLALTRQLIASFLRSGERFWIETPTYAHLYWPDDLTLIYIAQSKIYWNRIRIKYSKNLKKIFWAHKISSTIFCAKNDLFANNFFHRSMKRGSRNRCRSSMYSFPKANHSVFLFEARKREDTNTCVAGKLRKKLVSLRCLITIVGTEKIAAAQSKFLFICLAIKSWKWSARRFSYYSWH